MPAELASLQSCVQPDSTSHLWGAGDKAQYFPRTVDREQDGSMGCHRLKPRRLRCKQSAAEFRKAKAIQNLERARAAKPLGKSRTSLWRHAKSTKAKQRLEQVRSLSADSSAAGLRSSSKTLVWSVGQGSFIVHRVLQWAKAGFRGRGTYGHIFVARDVRTMEEFALKLDVLGGPWDVKEFAKFCESFAACNRNMQ